jgi:AcrR family transcriptional regulator
MSNAILDAEPLAPTLQERKQQVVRDAIWEAATDLFAEKGYDETTIEDIARKAGVSRRSFFRYFSSKRDLMAQGIVGFGGYLTDAIEACPPNCPLSAVFRETVRQVARRCAAHPRARKVMQIAAKYPAAKEAQESRAAELRQRVEKALSGRCEEKDLPPGILAGLILSVLDVTFRLWFEQGDQDASELAERVLASLRSLVCDNQPIAVAPQPSPSRKPR